MPKSKRGRDTVPVHPICHRAIHLHFTNAQLAKLPPAPAALLANPDLANFVGWVADKPPDFHAPTRRAR